MTSRDTDDRRPIAAMTVSGTPPHAAKDGRGIGGAPRDLGVSFGLGAAACPVDLIHLARQTFGDRGLACEVLRIFVPQAQAAFRRIAVAGTAAERRAAAHVLTGSARGVGAWRLADLAAGMAAETSESDLAEIGRAVEETAAFVDRFLESEPTGA